MTTSKLNYLWNAPSPNTITLRIRVSVHKFWGDTNIQSLTLGMLQFCDEREKEKNHKRASPSLPTLSFALETMHPKYAVPIISCVHFQGHTDFNIFVRVEIPALNVKMEGCHSAMHQIMCRVLRPLECMRLRNVRSVRQIIQFIYRLL